MTFHPATQIITWCILVVTLQALALGALLTAAGLILLCALMISRPKFIQLLRRTRWILLSLLLIYAYSTPGQPLLDALGMFSPSREGLLDGVVQLTRLLAAIAGLAILLDRLHREQLIAGLYALFAPLQWVGLSRERLAVRLALTLHYAEAAMRQGASSWQEALRSSEDRGSGGQRTGAPARDTPGDTRQHSCHPSADRGQLELPLSHFAVADALLLGGAMLVLWLAVR